VSGNNGTSGTNGTTGTSGLAAPAGTSGISGGSFTANDRVIYSTSSTTLKDSTFIYHDTTNSRLGVSIATPTQKLDVSDQARIGAARMGTWPASSTYAYFANDALSQGASVYGTYALLHNNDGTTYLNAGAGTSLTLRINNTDALVISSTLLTGVGSASDGNGRLYVYGEGTGNNFLSIANCNGIATTSSSGRALAGYVRIYINSSVSNSGVNAFGANNYYIAVYS